jgi:regulation of enolase protein 1 (concanavalin A-like superfamily)
MKWLNEPANWKANDQSLYLSVEPGTDFWRITHYGFTRDTGHFYYTDVRGDFEAIVNVSGQYNEQYHQAGLMIRMDNANWIKTGIEYVDGLQKISAVVTRDFSDWSVIPCPGSPEDIWLKLLRKSDYVQIDYSFDAIDFSMLRLAYFPTEKNVQIGLIAAAPGDKSFDVIFNGFQIRDIMS